MSEGIRLAQLTGAIARAADPSTGMPPETSLRTCSIAIALGRTAGLEQDELRDVFHAALLRHVGCTASSHEETQLTGDDLELRATLTPLDLGKPADALRLVGGLAKSQGPLKRARVVGKFLTQGGRAVPAAILGRCEVAIRFAVRLGLGPRIARALDEAYERYDGKGLPRGLRGEALSIAARVIMLAELAATHLAVGGVSAARDVVAARARTQLDPKLAALFAPDAERVLSAALEPSLWQRTLDAEPTPHVRIGQEQVNAVAELLADFADMKSTWTLGHSRAVAALASSAARILGLGAAEVEALRVAGLLHDLGRAAISNAIWDKTGPLDRAELDQVRAHTHHTQRVLELVGGPFADAARLASLAHERVDGSGYHRGLGSSALLPAARVLAAADVAEALSQARPQRSALGKDQLVTTMRGLARDGGLDFRAVEAVLAATGASKAPARSSYPAGLSEREVEVLRLVARGLTDKEVANKLGISHRTVHHHNQHAFTKIGVTTRAAAALFLTEHDLLGPSGA